MISQMMEFVKGQTILQKALGVAFDLRVGHDFIENAEERYEFYHLEAY